VVEPVVARYRGKFKRHYFRADAAFANPQVYEFLEAGVVSTDLDGRATDWSLKQIPDLRLLASRSE